MAIKKYKTKKTGQSAGKQNKQNKTSHLTFRVTQELNDRLVTEAKECGMSKSAYVISILEKNHPAPLMTKEQEEALMQFSAARADLVHISNVLQGKSQEERKAYFKNEAFMTAWIDGINYLIDHWKHIMHLFGA